MSNAVNGKLRKTAIVAFIAMLSVLAISLPTVALAGSFSYEGYGIRGWPSVGSAGIVSSTTGTVAHHQTRNYTQDNMDMTVYIRRQEWWGWSNVASKSFKGDTSGFSASCSPGTYKLYFEANDPLYAYDIWGSFSW